MKRRSFRPEDQTKVADPSWVEPDRTRAQRLTFAEDFLLEHSLSGVDIVKVEISGSTRFSPKERDQRKANLLISLLIRSVAPVFRRP